MTRYALGLLLILVALRLALGDFQATSVAWVLIAWAIGFALALRKAPGENYLGDRPTLIAAAIVAGRVFLGQLIAFSTGGASFPVWSCLVSAAIVVWIARDLRGFRGA